MKVFRQLITVTIVSVALAVAISVFGITQKAEAVTVKPTTTTTTKATDIVYKYIAQPGDSYSVLARKAVQTYGLKFKVKLTKAQIIYAETNLTQQAKSPLLNIGQKVSISENTVKQWINNASKLSTSQKAAWNYYVQFVNFNTSAVGQAT